MDEIKQARQKIASELEMMAAALSSTRLNIQLTPLTDAAGRCRSGSGMSPNQWGYDLDKLIFRPIDSRHCLPSGKYPIDVELSIHARSSILDDSVGADPFDVLAFNVVGMGKCNRTDYFFSWHLDRHITEYEHEEDSKAPQYMHPLYHFQFGGNRLSEFVSTGGQHGDLLIMDSPRLPHPPMDAILGIDFVLTNFFPQKELQFRMEGQYSNILESAQKRFWRPYVQALHKAWNEWPDSCSLSSGMLWPQLPSI